MTVKITLEFPSVEASIAALGLLMKPKKGETASAGAPVEGAKPTPVAAATPTPAGAPVAPATRTRKPRADKGQTREPYGPRAPEAGSASSQEKTPEVGTAAPTGVTSSAPAQQASGPSPATASADTTAPAVSTATSAGSSTEQPTEKAVQEALEKLFNATNIATSQAVLSRFGCKRVRELAAGKRVEFIAKCEAVIKGEAV